MGSTSQTRVRTGIGRAGSEPCIARGCGGRAEHERARRGCTRGKQREDRVAAAPIASHAEGRLAGLPHRGPTRAVLGVESRAGLWRDTQGRASLGAPSHGHAGHWPRTVPLHQGP
jgi:hypothetical protein